MAIVKLPSYRIQSSNLCKAFQKQQTLIWTSLNLNSKYDYTIIKLNNREIQKPATEAIFTIRPPFFPLVIDILSRAS